ncbi:sensor histidine kinase [Sulfurimonas marina]|uniref:Sensor histidine kinase n=1 Tax=Sulfurimonas marina TaxID=2590551 RepID=A0A7M3V9F8_9BACT|nr:histidine kinase [Sulfurimonas marina]QOP40391.1 sensor histidine kinase [Sulfurimonas marina]
MYKLKIKPKDWLLILVMGVVFSSLLSMLGYTLLDQSYIGGILFGGILGFCITLYSLVLITFMNTKVLPSLKSSYWNIVAAIFSFLSGFFGFLSGVFLAKVLGVELLAIVMQKFFSVSVIVGILTYIMGVIIYSFVNIRNQKEQRDYEYMQSRLRSLERQLNPHFMFNALNSIAELIHQDKDKAEEAILKISSFLRNSMDEKALISLEDELKNVKSYLELENIRFSNQLFLNIENEIPSWSVPKFSLQLLVENAIKHGYDRQDLHIFISFNIQRKKIVVSNDGIKISQSSFGVGLNNLKQRLELLCKGDIVISDPAKNQFEIYIGQCDENINS